jgi:hypothetical protein
MINKIYNTFTNKDKNIENIFKENIELKYHISLQINVG